MLRYTVRRLLQLVLVLFVLSLLLFIWLRSLPGGPVSALLGERATPEKREELNAVLGLDQPIFVQYFKFLGRVVQGNFGQSTGVSPGTSAVDVFITRFGATIELTLGAMIFGLALGIPLGYIAAKRRGGVMDNGAIVVSLIGIAVPVFFLAFLLKYVFSVRLGLLPPSGRQTPGIDATRVTGLFIVDGVITREWDAAWDSVRHLILPWIALGTIPFAVIFRITRASVLEVQGEDFVRTAEAKGLTSRTIRNRHVLHNAMLPVITVTGLLTGLLLTGAVLTEKVFGYPGIGEALYLGFTKKDYPVIQVIILAAAAAFVIINTLVDLTYALVDPRDQGTLMATTYSRARKQRIDALVNSGDEGSSLLQDAWARLKASPLFWFGAVIVGLFVVLAIIGPWIAPHDPGAQLLIGQTSRARNAIAPPQDGFPLGGDTQGRDLLSRMIVGARQTLLVGVFATLIGLVGGMILGILAGAFGGWVDTLVMRIVDVMLSIPSLLLAISIGVLFVNPNLTSVIIAVSIPQIPVFARLLRGQMLAQRESDHVLAARALGVKRGPIVFRHMVPNSISPVIVQATLVVATSILDAAALSFLGLGSQDVSLPEWGQMLGEAQTSIDSHPQLAFWPAGAIIVVVLGFTLLGEALREAIDPKNRR